MEPQRIIDSKHNLPPTDAEILADKLKENSRQDIQRMNDVLSKTVPNEILDEDQAKIVAEWMDKIKNLKKAFESTHKTEKAPYLEMGRVVDGFFKTKIETLESFRLKLAVPVNAYLNKKAEEERKAIREREEKARQEAEALAAQAVAHEEADIKDTAAELMSAAVQAEEKANALGNYATHTNNAKLASVRTETGASLVQKTRWVGEIEHIGAVDLEALRQFFTEEQIQTAINKFVRDGGRELRGVKIHQKASV